jgi:hypothetical protein
MNRKSEKIERKHFLERIYRKKRTLKKKKNRIFKKK